MTYKSEWWEIKKCFLIWLFIFFITTILLFSLKISSINLIGQEIVFFDGQPKTLVDKFFAEAKADLLPANIDVVATSPISVFFVQLKTALLGGFVVSLPYLLLSILSYISPALEKKRDVSFFLWFFQQQAYS